MKKQDITWKNSLYPQKLTCVKKNLSANVKLNNHEQEKHLRKNLELAQSLHVSGTLTFKFEGIDYGRRGYEAKNQRGAR